MTQNSILQGMLKNTIAKNKATIPVVPTKTQGTNNNIVFGGVPATENTVVPTQPTPQVKVANPITQPASNVQLQQNIYGTPKPTVATAQNPVREIGVPKPVVTPPATVQYDPSIYDQYNNYSKTDIQNWLDHATVLASQGQPLSTQDQLIARNFQRKLEEMNKPQDVVDPTKAMIEQTNADKEARRIALESQANTLYTSEEERLRKYYEQRKQDTLAGAERTKQAGQAATSFSGFGRSTFNADQQTQIQKEAEQALSIDQAEMQAALDKYNAQLQGATQEQLAQYDNRIAELQGKSLEFKQKQYEAINAYNAQTAQDMSTKLENLVTLAQQNIPQTPLTEEEKQQASAYASLIIGADGKVDTALMKEIPPRLISEAVTQGAMMKQAIKPEQEKFGFVNVGDGVIARTNPNTGAVEYTRSGFAQNKAPETVKTDNGTFQYNQTTGNYDIPVGSTGGSDTTSFIKKWEGFRDKAYKDATGTWTIGYGFTNVNGQPVQPGMTMDRGTADEILKQEINQRQNFMNYITVPLNENQKAALSSFEFNLGSGIREKNAMPILDKINQGDIKGAGEILKKYSYSKGQQLKGLANRRNEEANLLMQQPTQGENKPLTKEEKSTLFSIQDDLKSDPRRKEYLTLQSKIKTLDGIKTRLDTGKATAQDKQQLISDFAKVLDPTSVVRTEEYALAAKYGQSAINKTIQEISNWYDTNGPLSDTSAKVLAEAVGLRYEATQLSNTEAIEEQKKRAEIFLGRPVSYDELAVTPQQNTTPQNFTPAPQTDDEDIALFNKYM